jgi:hypothetical protein
MKVEAQYEVLGWHSKKRRVPDGTIDGCLHSESRVREIRVEHFYRPLRLRDGPLFLLRFSGFQTFRQAQGGLFRRANGNRPFKPFSFPCEFRLHDHGQPLTQVSVNLGQEPRATA